MNELAQSHPVRCDGGGTPDLSLGTRLQVLEPLRPHLAQLPLSASRASPSLCNAGTIDAMGAGLSPLPLAGPRVTLWLTGCASTGAYWDRSGRVYVLRGMPRGGVPLQGSLVRVEDRAGARPWLSHALPGRLAQVPGHTDWSHSLSSLHGHQLPSCPGWPELQSHCQRGEEGSGRTRGGGDPGPSSGSSGWAPPSASSTVLGWGGGRGFTEPFPQLGEGCFQMTLAEEWVLGALSGCLSQLPLTLADSGLASLAPSLPSLY